MYDAIVVGGGIVGASAAYHLARSGSETLLVDREDEGRATDAGAGILSPETSRHASETWYDFAVTAVRYYPDLVDSLSADGVGETGYAVRGTLVVDPPDGDPGAFEAGRRRILDRKERTGYPPDDRLYEVDPDEARDLFPALGDMRSAIYYEDGARVDGRTFRDALLDAGEAHGLELRQADAEAVLVDDDAVAGVVVDGERIPATNAVIAGGAWSPAFEDDLGIRVPVEPQRGQIVHLDTREVDTAGWPIVTSMGGHYLVPWDDNRVAMGATRESGVGFDPRTTAGGVHEVLDAGLATAPGLGDAAIEEVRVGLRPVSEDGLPAIGAVPGVEGAYLATGHGPTGLTLGPFSGKVVADLVRGEPVAVDLSGLRPDRFL